MILGFWFLLLDRNRGVHLKEAKKNCSGLALAQPVAQRLSLCVSAARKLR
jgi:hypothetical protein